MGKSKSKATAKNNKLKDKFLSKKEKADVMPSGSEAVLTKPSGFKESVVYYAKKGFFAVKQSVITYPYYYLAFILPIIILFTTFACLGMFPFGIKSILTLDMDGQYVYFFEQLRDVLTGEASFFYTLERSLGGEFLGYYTYYLASPLSVFVAIFPGNMITEAIMFIMLLKCGLSGLTFSIYLSKTRQLNKVGFTIFPVMYALCSYATMYQFNIMWQDALVWLPMIALGIEKLVSEGRFKLFTISLAFAVWSNYYIGYMLCIFVALYFFFALFSKSNSELNLLLEKHHRLKSLLRIVIFSVVALMLASAMIFSAYYSLSFGKSDFQNNEFHFKLRFDILHLISKMFIGSFDTVRSVGTPNVYAGTLLILMLPVYFMSSKIKPREKVAYSILSFIFILSFSVNAIDLVWHGFQEPIWFNYRYSFMFTFILLTMAYKGYEQLDTVNTKFFGKTAVFLVFLLAIIQKTITYVRYEVVNGSRIEVVDKPEYAMVWLSFLFIFLYFLLFYIKKHSFLKQTTTMLLAVVVCVEAFASTTINWVGEINDGGWASRGGYRAYVDKLEGATDEIYENDDGLFRMEHTIFRKNNDNLVANIKGISEFTSTFNQSSINFLRSLGIYTDGQTTKYINSNIFLDSLLGIKYIIGSYQDDTNGSFPGYNSVPSLYNSTNKDNGLVVYENPYALPLAFFADSEIKDYFIDGNEHSYLERINSLYSAVLGEDASIFDTCEYTVVKNSLQSYQVTEHGYTEFRKYSSQDSAYFTLVVTAERDGDIFMHLPSPWTTAATLSVNDVEFTNTLFQGENTGTVNLGYFEAGDTVRVKLSFSHHRLCIWESDYLFVQVNEEGFKNATDKLKAKGLQVESFSDSKIEGTITSDKNGSVYTTIPYDSCWKVYVDGERVETYKLTDAMLGFDISKGTHSVELKYVFSPFYAGLAVGLAGLMIFIGLCILDKKFGRRVSVPATEPTKEGAGEEETNTDSDNSHNESEEKNDLPS